MADTVKTAPKTTLPKEVFGVEVKNHELLKLAYDAYLSNSRHPDVVLRGGIQDHLVQRFRPKPLCSREGAGINTNK